MTITNELQLPEPLVAAVRRDGYSKGECDFSTTELVGPPRIAQLKRKWRKSLTEDASDLIFSLLGRAVHTILEKSASDRYIVEHRYFAEHDGVTVGGQIDIYDTETAALQDWKLTSRWKTADFEGKYPWSSLRCVPEGIGWVEQANINRLLMIRNGVEVRRMQYVAIYRDWSKLQAARSTEYPSHQVETFGVPLWPIEKAEEYLSERIRVHVAARDVLPMCTPEERWERPTEFAVMKPGNKRATKVCESEIEANQEAAALTVAATEKAKGKKTEPYVVQTRPGESVRCLNYCPVVAFCSFGRELLQKASGE